MKVMIIGSNGYLGARLYFDLKQYFQVIGTYNKDQLSDQFVQLDITNKEQISNVFSQHKPEVIIHTSNYPSPRHAVDNEEAYLNLNLESTKLIKEAAKKISAKIIFISSFAALDPSNIYGELKLKSEKILLDSAVDSLIVRPSLILGFSPNTKNDRPFNRVLKCLDQKVTGEFDSSWKFQPTYIGHISEVIKTAIDKQVYNKVVHVFCPSIQTQFSTAKDILEPFGVEVKSIDKQMNMPVQEKVDDELTSLGLPTCSYETMINRIQQEIIERETFVL